MDLKCFYKNAQKPTEDGVKRCTIDTSRIKNGRWKESETDVIDFRRRGIDNRAIVPMHAFLFLVARFDSFLLHSLHFSSDQGSFNSGYTNISINDKRSISPTWTFQPKWRKRAHGHLEEKGFRFFKTDSMVPNQERTYGAKKGSSLSP